MSPETVVTYLLHLEEHYNQDTPYHNNVHAADVAQSAYVLLSVGVLRVSDRHSVYCRPTSLRLSLPALRISILKYRKQHQNAESSHYIITLIFEIDDRTNDY